MADMDDKITDDRGPNGLPTRKASARLIWIAEGSIKIKKWLLKSLCCAIVVIAVLVIAGVVLSFLLAQPNDAQPTNSHPTFQQHFIIEYEYYETYDPWNPNEVQKKVKPVNFMDTYYFPFVENSSVAFADSKKGCNAYEKYELASLAGTNKEFLKRTAHLVSNVDADAVWMGGYFKIASRHPYLVYWANGKVSDALKSPKNIWCAPPEQVIPPVQEHAEGRDYTELILPIVRRKTNSSCLTIYVKDFLSSASSTFPSLCMMKDSFLSPKDDETLPGEFFKKVFDWNWQNTETSELFSMFDTVCDKKVQTEDYMNCKQGQQSLDDRFPLRHLVTEDFLMVGFPELVSYEYAHTICLHSRMSDGIPKGYTMGREVLNSSEPTLISDYKKSFLKAEKTFFKFGSPSTAAKFDFGKTVFFTYDNYVHNTPLLYWFGDSIFDNGWIGVGEATELPYNWCVGGDSSSDPTSAMDLVRQHYDEFNKWRNDLGNKTTDPFIVYITIDIIRNGPCIRIVADDLYWPGARSWLPVCIIKRNQ